MPSPFGSELWGLSPTPGVPNPGCDALNCINDVWFRLGFLNAQDMAVDDRWVTLAELYTFADDAAKRHSYTLGVFMAYDASVAVTAGTAEYSLPAAHVFTVLAWLIYAGLPLQLLRLSSAGQLFALDSNWSLTVGDPLRFSLDASGEGTGVLYPSPVRNATLGQIMQKMPADVVAGASSLPLSPVCQDYVSYSMLATALSKESDSARPEVAAHCKERMGLYEKLFEHYWGPGA